ncbi:MAG: hypothetical protein RLO50_01775 [Azospirillaceae bacterium]
MRSPGNQTGAGHPGQRVRTPSGDGHGDGHGDARPDRDRLAVLKARIARIERGGARRWPAVSLGLEAVDGWLPDGGLRQGALHEVMGAPDQAASLGFLAGLAARCAAARRGPVLWIVPHLALYPPGLAAIGLGPERLILATVRQAQARLWALEEAARTPALGAAVADLADLDLTAGRRLQLAAEESGVPVLVHHLVHHRHRAPRRPEGREGAAGGMAGGMAGEMTGGAAIPPGAAITRWRVAALPGLAPAAGGDAPVPDEASWPGLAREDVPGVGDAVWRLELLRARGGQPAAWDLTVDAAGGWRLAVPRRLRPPFHRDPDPAAPALAGDGAAAAAPAVLAWRKAS